uniref:Uncharacterized protein n=1 Tax=Picea sitchensis TaxID=3332 RepID=A0A6B9XWA9_PICSI|nr:hypothetical protein Q903MT_gene4309 [Picea sitchensis]
MQCGISLKTFFIPINLTAVSREVNHRASNFAKTAVTFIPPTLHHFAGTIQPQHRALARHQSDPSPAHSHPHNLQILFGSTLHFLEIRSPPYIFNSSSTLSNSR